MSRLSAVSTAPLLDDDLSDAQSDQKSREVLAAVEAATDRFLDDGVIDFHFRLVGGRCIDRDGRELFEVLSECASGIARRALRFNG